MIENINYISECTNSFNDIKEEIEKEDFILDKILKEENLIINKLNELDLEINKFDNNNINEEEENSIEEIKNIIHNLSIDLNNIIISINNINQRNLINCEKIIQSEKNNISLNDEILKIYQSLKLIELSEFSLCDRLNLIDKKLKNII